MNGRYGAARAVDFGTLMARSFENLRLIGRQIAAYLAILVAAAFLLPLFGQNLGGGAGIVAYLAGQYWLFQEFMKARGMLETQRNHFLAFVGLAVVLILPIIFGLGLFILPGLFLVARWIAAPAFVVARGEGVFASATSSWNAVRGSTLKVAGAVTVFFVLVSLFGVVASLVDGILSAVDAFGTAKPANVIQVNLFPLLLLGLSTATYELLGPEDTSIEEVFG